MWVSTKPVTWALGGLVGGIGPVTLTSISG